MVLEGCGLAEMVRDGKTINSANLTNQRVSYAFAIARLISMSVIHVLRSSSIVILVFCLFSTDISEQHVWELWVWIQRWFDASSSGTPVNNPTLILYHQYSPWATFLLLTAFILFVYSSANFRPDFSESQNANPLDAKPETDFNAKWQFKVIQGHLFRCQRRATKGLHNTITIRRPIALNVKVRKI